MPDINHVGHGTHARHNKRYECESEVNVVAVWAFAHTINCTCFIKGVINHVWVITNFNVLSDVLSVSSRASKLGLYRDRLKNGP